MRIKLRTTAVAPRQAMTAAISEAKARQLSKIRELRLALRRAGLIGLDEQAQALGLPRSTTWKILKGGHRASGFSAMVISRMLSEPRLPPVVRIKILEYVRCRHASEPTLSLCRIPGADYRVELAPLRRFNSAF